MQALSRWSSTFAFHLSYVLRSRLVEGLGEARLKFLLFRCLVRWHIRLIYYSHAEQHLSKQKQLDFSGQKFSLLTNNIQSGSSNLWVSILDCDLSWKWKASQETIIRFDALCVLISSAGLEEASLCCVCGRQCSRWIDGSTRKILVPSHR